MNKTELLYMKNNLFQVSSFFLLRLSFFDGPPGKLAEASYYLWIEKRVLDSREIFLSSGRGLMVFDLTQ